MNDAAEYAASVGQFDGLGEELDYGSDLDDLGIEFTAAENP